MSLEQSFRRLAIQSKSVCHQCRRTLATTARPQQQQSATGAFHEVLQSNRDRSYAQRAPTTHPSRPSEPTAFAAPPSPSSPAAYQLAENTVHEASAARRATQAAQTLKDAERNWNRKDLEGQIPRRWKVGDVYSPHDLSGVEMSKWKKQRRKPRPRAKDRDVMDQLGMNPLDHYRNFSIMGEYVTEMGRIRGSAETGLRPVNQRRMAKAVRRAIGIGLMPSVYRHPELLREEMEARKNRYG